MVKYSQKQIFLRIMQQQIMDIFVQENNRMEVNENRENNLKRSRPWVEALQARNALENIRTNNKTLTQIKGKNCGLRQGCEDFSKYQVLNKIHHGTYGTVYRARNTETSQVYAVKEIELVRGYDFPTTSIREITILKSIQHENIVKIHSVVKSHIKPAAYIVMEYVDHELKSFLQEHSFKEQQVRRLMKDLLSAIAQMHDKKFLHRDLKSSNLLYSNEGILKICDFGLARKAALKQMTQEVITMLYRPPELLLGKYCYSTELDIWSVGVIMAEMVLRQLPVYGKTEIELLDSIFKFVGSPTEQTWPEFRTFTNAIFVQGKKYMSGTLDSIMSGKLSVEGIDLLKQLLTLNPTRRISAAKALNNQWFSGPISLREDMPQSTPLNDSQRSRKRVKTNDFI